MLAATVLWAWAEILKISGTGHLARARGLYTAALVLALGHAAMAFEVAYSWSHRVAMESTAAQTAALTGIRWGGGIFVNYLFLAVWTADAIRWWAAPAGYTNRRLPVDRLRLAFFLFMFINGAIVFAGTTARLIGVPAVAAVGAAWILNAWRRPAHA